MTNFQNVLNYKCRSLSNFGTNKISFESGNFTIDSRQVESMGFNGILHQLLVKQFVKWN